MHGCTVNPGRLVSYVQGDRPVGAAEPGRLDINDKLWVSIGESSKLVLVQVHDEEFVRRSEFDRLPGELFVEVGSVSLVLLLNGKHRIKHNHQGEKAGKSFNPADVSNLGCWEGRLLPLFHVCSWDSCSETLGGVFSFKKYTLD